MDIDPTDGSRRDLTSNPFLNTADIDVMISKIKEVRLRDGTPVLRLDFNSTSIKLIRALEASKNILRQYPGSFPQTPTFDEWPHYFFRSSESISVMYELANQARESVCSIEDQNQVRYRLKINDAQVALRILTGILDDMPFFKIVSLLAMN